MPEAAEELEGKLFAAGPAESCRVEVRRHSLIATTASRVLRFPYDRSHFSDGGEGTLVVTMEKDRQPQVLKLSKARAVAAIRAVADPDAVRRLDGSERSARRRWLRPSTVTAALLVLVVIGAGVVHLVANRLVEKAVERVPVAWETVLGREVINEEFPKSKALDDPVVVDAIQQITDRLLAAADVGEYQFRVHVMRSPQFNAFALPGGEIVVLSNLIASAEAPEEVAGVLAHEIQHVLGRHGLRSMVEQLRWEMLGAVLAGDVESTGETLLARSATFLMLSYSRDHEREADLEGIDLMDRADIDPGPMIDFYERMSELGGGLEPPEFLSTHPGGQSRVDALEERLTELGVRSYEPFDMDWDEVRRRASVWY